MFSTGDIDCLCECDCRVNSILLHVFMLYYMYSIYVSDCRLKQALL